MRAHGGVARQDDGVLGRVHQSRGGGNVAGVRVLGARLGRQDGRGGRAGLHGHGGNVAGEVYVRGAGLLGLGVLEGNAHDLRDGVRPHDLLGALGDGGIQAVQIQVLVGSEVHAVRAHLAGYGHHRRAVGVGVGHAGYEVGGAGPQGRQAHAGLACEAAVHVCHEGRTLLVADGHELDAGLAQGLAYLQVLLAGNAEDVLHTLSLQAANQHLRCRRRFRRGWDGRFSFSRTHYCHTPKYVLCIPHWLS